MNTQTQGIVQGWKSCEENDDPVPGIHFKVEQDFQVIQYSIVDIVGFINDNDQCLTFFQGKPVEGTV